MPDATNTFEARLGCDNCGHAEVHHLPIRAKITNYDYEDGTPSSYQVGLKELKIVICTHCRLPHLRVLWFKESEVEFVNA